MTKRYLIVMEGMFDSEAYMDGKDGLIKTIERAALEWWVPPN